jgi:hypothetical protein
MHLDPTVIAFGTAIVSLATAITGLVRAVLEKKSNSGTADVPQKKLKSVPRGMNKASQEQEAGTNAGWRFQHSFAAGLAAAMILHDLGYQSLLKKPI